MAPTLVLTIRGRLHRGDIPALCAYLTTALAAAGAERIECDLAGLGAPDAVAVETLARLRLTAGRHGAELRLARAPAELHGLVELMGLSAQLGLSCVEARRQAEQREQARRIEEESDPRDPSA